MTARSYPSTIPTTNDVVNADSMKAGVESTSMDPAHRVGNTVDKVDQVSSITLLGFAVTGAVLVILTHLVLG
ncbi:hypothetical protein [uncultured Methylobacterium sp.]|uniref:hypothetical protein n=1 Tax=uncultured Methylobacterium sp. TaxID=157278 RepID=UPI0035CA0CD0